MRDDAQNSSAVFANCIEWEKHRLRRWGLMAVCLGASCCRFQPRGHGLGGPFQLSIYEFQRRVQPIRSFRQRHVPEGQRKRRHAAHEFKLAAVQIGVAAPAINGVRFATSSAVALRSGDGVLRVFH